MSVMRDCSTSLGSPVLLTCSFPGILIPPHVRPSFRWGGAGEVGSTDLTAVNGPHYWLAHGWDGGVQLGNGKHYPIIISVQANQDWPQTTEDLMVLTYILNTYHIKRSSVHLCGLSMGAFSWSALICHQTTPGGEDGMKLVTSLVCLEGQSQTVSAAVAANELPNYNSFGHWAKKYHGRFFGLEGIADYRNVSAVSQNMNDSVPGSAYFSYQNIGGGLHCCWNSMFDPSVTDWTCVGTLGPNNALNAAPNTMGDYYAPSSIFQWMLRQGDTSMVGLSTPPATTPPNVAPVANAGTAQTITLPLDSTLLSGSATDEGGYLHYQWTKVSGPAGGTLVTDTLASTEVRGLQAGTYIFQLAVTDTGALTGTSQVQITVNAAAATTPPNVAPVVNAGTAQTITLPLDSTLLSGSATDEGGYLHYQWTKVSGPAGGTLVTDTLASTEVRGLQAGTYVFQLAVTDTGALTGTSQVQITVNAAAVTTPPNVAPVVNAGTAQTITLPLDSTLLPGSATDEGGYLHYQWTKVSGPAGGMLVTDTLMNTEVRGLQAGIYVFQLAVTDTGALTGTAQVQITVNLPVVTTPPPVTGGPLYVKKVAVAEYRAAYLATDGNVYSFLQSPLFKYDYGARKIVDVTGGFNMIVALDDQGYCWTTRLGDNVVTRYDTDTTGAPFNNNLALFSYTSTYISLRSDSSLWYWGLDTFHLYHSTGGVLIRPIQLSPAGMKFKKVVMGLYRILALTSDGQIYEWYRNGSLTPTQKVIPAPACDIFASHWDYAGCIIPDNPGDTMGYPYVWGTNYGFWGGTGPLTTPTSVKALWNVTAPIKEIATDYNTTHYIDSLGRMFGIGDNVMGEVGIGKELVNQYNYVTPYGWDFNRDEDLTGSPAQQIGVGVKWKKLFSNNFLAFYKYALDENDSLYFWGRDKAMVSGRGYLDLDEAAYPNAWDVLAPLMVHPLGTIAQTYHFTKPWINAGINQSITTTSATLTGSAQAPLLIKATTVAANGIDTAGFKIVSYVWTKVSGPAATITSPNAATTTVTGLTPGVYVFNLKTTDNNTGTQSANVTITMSTVVVGNQPPVANAGADQTITLPVNTVTLSGSGTDPDGTIASYQWTQIAGPATAAIAAATQAGTAVNNLVEGTYQFRLTVFDNQGASSSDTMSVIVNPAPVVPGNPVANAGADQTITLPVNTVTLSGSGSETSGTIVGYQWKQVSGASNSSIVDPNQAQTVINNLEEGVYIFQLTVTDNSGKTATDQVKITVNAAVAVNVLPVANAGADQTLTGVTQTSLDGSASYDPDGSIVKYQWVQTMGAGGITIAGANTVDPIIYGLQPGTYQFSLTVTDNSGATASDLVTITVQAGQNNSGGPGLTANAGRDTTISFPGTTDILLNGSASSDMSGTITGYNWQQVSGPAGAALSDPAAVATQLSSLQVGVYVYRLTVTDNNNQSASDTVTIRVLSNLRQDEQMGLYPNPAPLNGQITLSGISSYTGKVVYTIRDLQGRAVSAVVADKQAPNLSQVFNLGGLMRGVYILVMTYDDGSKPKVYKFIID